MKERGWWEHLSEERDFLEKKQHSRTSFFTCQFTGTGRRFGVLLSVFVDNNEMNMVRNLNAVLFFLLVLANNFGIGYSYNCANP